MNLPLIEFSSFLVAVFSFKFQFYNSDQLLQYAGECAQ